LKPLFHLYYAAPVMTRLLVVIVDALLFKMQINTYGW